MLIHNVDNFFSGRQYVISQIPIKQKARPSGGQAFVAHCTLRD